MRSCPGSKVNLFVELSIDELRCGDATANGMSSLREYQNRSGASKQNCAPRGWKVEASVLVYRCGMGHVFLVNGEREPKGE
jgi:hypothetical protein